MKQVPGTCFIKDKASDNLLPENDESQQEDKYLPFEWHKLHVLLNYVYFLWLNHIIMK